MNKYLSKCCNAEKKVYHGGEGTSYFQCSACGKEFIGVPTPEPDQVTDLEKLIEEACYRVEPGDEEIVEKYIKLAYELGLNA